MPGLFSMWLITENPWYLIVLCTSAAVYFLFKWWTTHRGLFMVLGVALLLMSAGFYYLDQTFTTDAEQIEANIHEMAAAVVANDTKGVLKFFSPRAERFRARIAIAMGTFNIRDDMRITDMEVEVRAENTLATSHFRANATIVGKASALGGRGATRWLLKWQKQEGEWKITEVIRLHPIDSNQVLDIMDRAD